ncbi:MAG: hypothetical protein NZ959_03540 [Armatimonadetes bacterium]|nr:hypothetical protein [Armatimonadota bacterium]MDW8121716.1 hypothetical protein [Armatimonadota bacterium]
MSQRNDQEVSKIAWGAFIILVLMVSIFALRALTRPPNGQGSRELIGQRSETGSPPATAAPAEGQQNETGQGSVRLVSGSGGQQPARSHLSVSAATPTVAPPSERVGTKTFSRPTSSVTPSLPRTPLSVPALSRPSDDERKSNALWQQDQVALASLVALCEVGRRLHRFNEVALVEEAFRQAQSWLSVIKTPFIRSKGLVHLADAYFVIEREREAQGLLGHAIQLARSVTDSQLRSVVLTEIANVLCRWGLTDRASDLLKEVDDPFFKSVALSGLARGLSQSGRWDVGQEIARQIAHPLINAEALAGVNRSRNQGLRLSRALETAHLIAEEGQRSMALAQLAGRLAERGWADQALSVSQRIADPGWQAASFAFVSAGLRKAGKWSLAAQLLNEAIQYVRNSQDPLATCAALSALASALAESGRLTEAENYFEQARGLAFGITDPLLRTQALIFLAEALSADDGAGAPFPP